MSQLACDIAIVGGGIAGSALATVLAREGLDVVVLERQRAYADRVRGENLHPWGVAEAQRLGLDDVLGHAGGHLVQETVDYGDGDDPDAAEAALLPLGDMVPGVPGELNLAHPAACEALAQSAVAEGARVLRGVSHIAYTPRARPRVAYRRDGAAGEVACRLVVGADGRSSRVRRQAGITLQRATGTHLIAGMLVDGLDLDPRRNVVVTGEDVWMVTFPQGGGRARVYLCPGIDEPQRYAGPSGTERFLAASCFDAVPKGQAWAEAAPAGPCHTFPAEDTWTRRPFAEGVVLIGDAAGYNNPLIGQGLALALRDVRALRDLLLDTALWDLAALDRYGADRAERLRRVRFIGQLHAEVWTTFGPEGRRQRREVRARQRSDPELQSATLAIFTGPDQLDPQMCTEAFRRRYLGLDS